MGNTVNYVANILALVCLEMRERWIESSGSEHFQLKNSQAQNYFKQPPIHPSIHHHSCVYNLLIIIIRREEKSVSNYRKVLYQTRCSMILCGATSLCSIKIITVIKVMKSYFKKEKKISSFLHHRCNSCISIAMQPSSYNHHNELWVYLHAHNHHTVAASVCFP